jgi:hypothetical protein
MTSVPRNIWYADAVVKKSPVLSSVVPQMSQSVGTANASAALRRRRRAAARSSALSAARRTECRRAQLWSAKGTRHSASPANMQAVWKPGWKNAMGRPAASAPTITESCAQPEEWDLAVHACSSPSMHC